MTATKRTSEEAVIKTLASGGTLTKRRSLRRSGWDARPSARR
jgi:hypothetical protein